MNANDYQAAALRTFPTIDNHTFDENVQLAALGLTGEAGEFADIIKKYVYHHHPFSAETHIKLVHELGDILWYVACAAHALNFDLSSVMQMNIEKLQARYPEGFSTEASLNRKD